MIEDLDHTDTSHHIHHATDACDKVTISGEFLGGNILSDDVFLED